MLVLALPTHGMPFDTDQVRALLKKEQFGSIVTFSKTYFTLGMTDLEKTVNRVKVKFGTLMFHYSTLRLNVAESVNTNPLKALYDLPSADFKRTEDILSICKQRIHVFKQIIVHIYRREFLLKTLH